LIMRAYVVTGLVVAATFLAAPTRSQEAFPQEGRPVEITVLFPAGTSADITARMLAEGMAKHLRASVIVVNRPGAAGAIGYRHVAAQKADGHALVWNSNSISTAHHAGQLAFDYRAFDGVARVLVESPIVVVRSDAKWPSLAALVADARAAPGKLTVGNSGVGSHTHISSVALFRTAEAKVTDVPYAAAQVMPGLLGGHVDVLVQLPAAVTSHVKSGAVRILATLVTDRDPALPGVPTAREQGVDIAIEAWRGIAVPKGTPPAAIGALQSAIEQVVQSPEFIAGAARLGVRPAFLPGAAFDRIIAAEDEMLARLMHDIGLKKH